MQLHDCHWPNPDVVDMHVVFPDPRADPERAGSYDFLRTDEYLRAIVAIRSGIVYRLGESIEHHKVKKYVHPPKDPARFAAASLGIIRHYNDGWANGHKYGIRYWEIWNEPENQPAMWTGTDEEYFRLYSTTAKAIKARYPDLRVGGPALGNTGELKGDTLTPSPFFRRFLDHCRTDAAPLDFFSWHCYTNDPGELARRARAVRRLLDDAGFRKTESHLNEWNYLPDGDWMPMLSPDGSRRQRWNERVNGAEGAAFVAAGLIALQDAPLDAANYFTADVQTIGLFDGAGVSRKNFHAFRAFRSLTDTPRRVAINGKLPAGMFAGAGVDAKSKTVTLLLSKMAGPAQQVTVRLAGLPQGRMEYDVLRLTDRHDLTRAEAGSTASHQLPALTLTAPAVYLFTVRVPADRNE
ncbi:MAG: hypothetical protein U0736_08080 [Gemmataceae bacterium]